MNPAKHATKMLGAVSMKKGGKWLYVRDTWGADAPAPAPTPAAAPKN